MANPSEQQIRARAFGLWELAGKPEGRDDEFWRQAEQTLKATEELRDVATAPPQTLLPG